MIVGHEFSMLLAAVAIASVACYVAIDVLHRIERDRPRARYLWSVAAAVVLGSGIYSTVYLVLFAIRAPLDLRCSVPLAIASWIFGVVGCANAFMTAARPAMRVRRLLLGATLAAIAFAAQFYVSLASLHITLRQDYPSPRAVVAFVLLEAICLSGTGLAHRIREPESLRGIALSAFVALLVGFGLVASEALAIDHSLIRPAPGTDQTPSSDINWLTSQTTSTLLLIAALAVVATALDRRFRRRTTALLSSLRVSNRRLQYRNRHDKLTDLSNRDALYADLEARFKDLRPEKKLALIAINIDGFRIVNDNLGHVFGDQLLQRVARTLQTRAGNRHLLARVNADEFTVVQHDIENEDAAAAFAAELRTDVVQCLQRDTALTASGGVAIYPDDARDAISLISAANMALSAAKRAGGNQACRYCEQMGAQRNEAFRTREELRLAVSRRELIVHYQPKYGADGLALAGVEALVRWQHPERGLVLPGAFIETAEHSGLIRDIENEVLDIVLRQITAWRAAGFHVPPIAVNLSMAHLLDENLIPQLESALERYRLSPKDLIFEITETLAMQKIESAKKTLGELNALGAQIALDDFGTGYSSLSYLQSLPIQQLKIDQSFISGLKEAGSTQNEIVKLIIDLAHVLDLVVVAEGVETAAQKDYLCRIGCDQLQGFFLDRPMTADELLTRLT